MQTNCMTIKDKRRVSLNRLIQHVSFIIVLSNAAVTGCAGGCSLSMR